MKIRIKTVESCTSTNDLLRDVMLPEPDDLHFVMAGEQTAGRGQMGNRWHSDKGANILFSVLLTPSPLVIGEGFVLSQAMALAVCRTLQRRLPDDCVWIKWPNDIYVRDKKICGILIENTLKGKTIERSIIGCGINVNQITFPDGLAAPATSLRMLTGRGYEFQSIMDDITGIVASLYQSIREERWGGIEEAYHKRLLWLGEQQTFRDKDGDFRGTIVRVLKDGHLVVMDSDGVERKYMFKEIKKI